MRKFTTFSKYGNQGFRVLEKIQSLWSGYGSIVRLENENDNTLVAKHISPPSNNNHPRGWNTDVGHQRKLQSYINELNWYRNYAHLCNNECKIPKLINFESIDNEHLLILEDLSNAGFPKLPTSINLDQIKVVLKWLANFHATFLNNSGISLWEVGTYWHLGTRQEEFEIMKAGQLKDNAEAIDTILNNCQFKTLVHGDAKLANFCFSNNGDKVAAVDFQYTGKGCGMKDVVYFLGSCLTNSECQNLETTLLSYYFSQLEIAIVKTNPVIDFQLLANEWQNMYSFAWADFHRFLLGWMPNHQKLTNYSKKQVSIALNQL